MALMQVLSNSVIPSLTPQLRSCNQIHYHYQHHPILTTLQCLLTTTTQTQNPNPNHINQLHAQLTTTNAITFPHLHTQLINLYAKLGQTNQALLTFQTIIHHSNIVTWTSLITHFSHSNRPFHALKLFSQLLTVSGLRPNPFTFSAILPACAATALPAHGHQVHALVHKHGVDADVFVASALTDMYAKCDDMVSSKKLFDEMPERNLVSWNAIIVGFVRNKFYEKAIEAFLGMLLDPDEVTLSSVLSACANSGGLSFGRRVHAHVVKNGLESLGYVKNSLLDMYTKCLCSEEATLLFGRIKDRDVVTWNIMMMGWVQSECFEEACRCFRAMRREGVTIDEASFSTVLHASATMASWGQGATIHSQIAKTGFATNCCIASSLITMYSKCGSLEDAYRCFEDAKDYLHVVSWTAMIAAFQQHGHGNRVIELFEKMLEEGIEPDYITFVCVLSACSHNGLVDQGFKYFHSMSKIYNMVPGSEHYACIVDLLGRAGRLEEAKQFIYTMPVKPDASVWGALLGACRNFGDLELGKKVAQKLFEIEPENPGNYVLLSNMYAYHGRLEEAKEIRRLMGASGVRKETGCSWIDVKNKTYVFTVQDQSHGRTKEIYEMLERLEEMVKKKGYAADTRFAVNDVRECKEQALWYHSERLALAFGLMSLPADAPIRIKKNLRTCVDCHAVIKLISGILNREIIVRDTNRFHRFTDGLCSCGDYW